MTICAQNCVLAAHAIGDQRVQRSFTVSFTMLKNCRGITPEVKEQLLAAVAKNRDKLLKAFRLGDQSDTGVLSSKRFFAC